EFASGDRVYFLKNERSLGVKNGSLGTIEKIKDGILQIRMDGDEDRRVAVDSSQYAHLDHGYATTIHKAQGTTVDRTFVLATPHFDRHSTYVALSRHRESVTTFYAAEDFGADSATDDPSSREVRDRFEATLSRARPKELAHDYLDPTLSLPARPSNKHSLTAADIDAIQQSAVERWLAKQHVPKPDLSAGNSLDLGDSAEPDHDGTLDVGQENYHQTYRGPEDDLKL